MPVSSKDTLRTRDFQYKMYGVSSAVCKCLILQGDTERLSLTHVSSGELGAPPPMGEAPRPRKEDSLSSIERRPL